MSRSQFSSPGEKSCPVSVSQEEFQTFESTAKNRFVEILPKVAKKADLENQINLVVLLSKTFAKKTASLYIKSLFKIFENHIQLKNLG